MDGTGVALVSGVVNTGVVGTYVVEYDYTDTNGNVASTETRTITIVDTTEPVVTLNGSGVIVLEAGDTYVEQ